MNTRQRQVWRYPLGLLVCLLPVTVWSFIDCFDPATWWLETIPVLIALPILLATARRFPLTPLLYILIGIHGVILLVGGHYTYALVPAGDWLRDALDLSRNHYDRLGHLAQGFVPALVARELLLRHTGLGRGGWLFAVITLSVLGISAAYELLEWLSFEMAGEDAENFLGQQGDLWDAQKDMLMALIGAITAQLTLARIQDRQIAAL